MVSSSMNKFMGYDTIFFVQKDSADSRADDRRKSSRFVRFFRLVIKKFFTAGKHWPIGFLRKKHGSLGTGGFEGC